MKIIFINSRYLAAIIFVLLALSVIPNASGAIINFSGQLDYVALDAGSAVYSDVPLGTDFFGAIDDIIFSGFISDGTTLTSFTCCIAAGGLSVSNDHVLDTNEAMMLNALGLPTLSAGDKVDIINIEGDVLTGSGGRIEIGLSYIFDVSVFSDESLSNYPFDPTDLKLALFFIAEFDALGNEIYSAAGELDTTSAPANLGYAPVSPCRIVDTRIAGGAISPGTIRGYNVWGDVSAQGGNPAGCPSPKGEPYGVHINVTAVPVSGSGNIVAYPFGSAAPAASLVNYKTGAQNVANGGTVKTCFNCGKDINIKSNYGTTHVVIDVLGYYFDNPWH